MKILERFLMVWDVETKAQKGALVQYWDSTLQRLDNPTDLPIGSEDLNLVLAELGGLQTQEIAQLKAENLALKSEIESLKAKIPPSENWQTLIQDLMNSSFSDWLIEACKVNPSTASLMAKLSEAVSQQDVQVVKDSFAAIVSIHSPSVERLQEWQAILNNLSITSLAFIPPST